MNIRNLTRYSNLRERTCHRHYGRSFDFVAFNRALIDQTFAPGSERILVFDPTFIKKAGKKTHGRGYFYNSCHHRAEPGLEIGALCLVDLSLHTGLCLSVRQSLPTAEKAEDTLMDQYTDQIASVRPHLHESERTLVVDGSLMRKKMIAACSRLGLCLVGKLRRDALMRYYYDGAPRPSGSGLQKIYGDAVDWQHLKGFEDKGSYNGQRVYTKILNHKRFKARLRVVMLVDPSKQEPDNYMLLASTNTDMDALDICRYYQARYQIEFLFRDAKQHTGLSDAQIRHSARLDFHFNASMAALNIGKSELITSHQNDGPFVCSMASLKVRYFNEHDLSRFFDIFQIDQDMAKESGHYHYLCNYGAMAA